jgi:hypothetical protein
VDPAAGRLADDEDPRARVGLEYRPHAVRQVRGADRAAAHLLEQARE